MADLMNPGGGLTKSKLELATADPSAVVEGFTFYSGDKKLKTGIILDRNTVGKNACIGMNSNFPEVALSRSSQEQVTHALDGNDYVAMQPPYGVYWGQSYVGALKKDICNLLTFVPIVIIGGAAIRLSSNIDSNYVSGVYSTGGNVPYGNGALWNQNDTTNITLTLKKAGRYAFFCSNRTDSGSSTKYFTINGTRYNAPNKQVRYLNAGATCQVYCDSNMGDWAYWGFCICYLG